MFLLTVKQPHPGGPGTWRGPRSGPSTETTAGKTEIGANKNHGHFHVDYPMEFGGIFVGINNLHESFPDI